MLRCFRLTDFDKLMLVYLFITACLFSISSYYNVQENHISNGG